MVMTRDQVVEEARTWIGTPYVKGGMIKGVGCDCATFILAVFRAAGIVPADSGEESDFFSNDWFANTDKEHYMTRVIRHVPKFIEQHTYAAERVEPGNIILLKAARSSVFNHGAIVAKWPRIIHAIGTRVLEVDVSRDPLWSHQAISVFDPWEPKTL